MTDASKPVVLGVVLGPLEAERESRLRSRTAGSIDAVASLRAAMACLAPADAVMVEDALRFARGLGYDHPGLTTDAYLAHPVRMAVLSLRLTEPYSVLAAVIALVHNVLEVTSTARASLEQRLGRDVAAAVELLAVDRSRQHDRTYVESYYAAIRAADPAVGLVKILDKLDNLFLLDVNPDHETRRRYLAEIERELVPIAGDIAPRLMPYLVMLIDDQRARLVA
jgi:(p)ppGpp synthase/HD superfamily hydrolase